MTEVRSALWRLRRLRLEETAHNERASEYLHRATRGMGMKHATDIGGTGNCPLTDNADRYEQERAAADRARQEADTIWAGFVPVVAALELDARSVVERYYNVGMAWEDIPAAVKRSLKSCERLHREALAQMERDLP